MACLLTSTNSGLLHRQVTQACCDEAWSPPYVYKEDHASHLENSASGTFITQGSFDRFRESVHSSHPNTPWKSTKAKEGIQFVLRKTNISSAIKKLEEDGDSSDDDTKSPTRKRKLRATSSSPVRLRFACPYTKSYISTPNSNRLYRSPASSDCFECQFATIGRLKHHLYRRHTHSQYHCQRCDVDFRNSQDLQAHEMAAPVCERAHEQLSDRMNPQQRLKLAKVKEGPSGKRNLEKLWYEIYRILFPNLPLPKSPYCHHEEIDYLEKDVKLPSEMPVTNVGELPIVDSLEQQNKDTNLSASRVRDEIIAEASREVIREWALNSLILGLRSDLREGFNTNASGQGKPESKKRKASDKCQGSKSKQRKRDETQGNDDNDDGNPSGDDDSNGHESNQPSDPPEPDEQIMCPYYWHDCERYSRHNVTENEYRHCESVKINNIARLRLHLWRVHKRPDFYCGRCCEKFENQDAVNDHLQQDTPCIRITPPKFTEKMTSDQYHTIKEHRFYGPISDSYKFICSVLFPNEPPPPSPFHIDRRIPSRTFLRRRLPVVLTRIYRRRNLPLPPAGFSSDLIEEIIQGIEELADPIPLEAPDPIAGPRGHDSPAQPRAPEPSQAYSLFNDPFFPGDWELPSQPFNFDLSSDLEGLPGHDSNYDWVSRVPVESI